MHPSPSRQNVLPDPSNKNPIYLEVETNQVQDSILSFPHGLASGLDGISPQHLKDLISKSANEQGNKLLENIIKLINFMLKGKVNSEIVKFFYGANLCSLNKKDGGLRPNEIGCVF